MNVRQSVMGEIAIRNGANVTGIDLDGLLRRMLLFDTVIIKSVRLREISFLVRALGKEGFRQLLNSGVMKINCEFFSLTWPRTRNGVRVYPPYTFSFGKADIADREGLLKSELRLLQGVPCLKNQDRELIEGETLAKLLRPHAEYGDQLLSQFELDIRNGTPALELSLKRRIEGEFGKCGAPIRLKVHETEPRVFRIENNLSEILAISDEKADEILNDGVGAVGKIDQRVADMAAYSSITGFSEAEASLLFGKLAGILLPMNPATIEEQFARVVTLADFPEFSLGKKLKVDRLLAVRESAELREFRAWISGLDRFTDAQVLEMIAGVRNKLGALIQSGPGKALRLAVTTAVGLCGVAPGVAAGVLDTFLLERLFPNSGVCAFLTKRYPSLFEKA